MAENKIKYGLKNVYYATVSSVSSAGAVTYNTPVAFPGAVSLSMEPQGEISPFFADNIKYWVSNANNGYEGDLEMARVIDKFRENVLGYIKSGNNLLVEDANANPVHFALMFQFEGDVKATRHVIYDCTASRPAASGSTKNESIEPQTESVTISAGSIYVAALQTDVVKSQTIDSTATSVYDNWFSAVTIPTATSN